MLLQQPVVANLDLQSLRRQQEASVLAGEATIEDFGSSTRRYQQAVKHYQTQEAEHINAIKNDASVLNSEQKQVVS